MPAFTFPLQSITAKASTKTLFGEQNDLLYDSGMATETKPATSTPHPLQHY